MNLNKQQLNAVAGEIFKRLEELRLKEIEKLTPTILKDKKLFLLKTLVEKRLSLDNQIFKAGTSVGANVREAQNAESKADFIHKMKISAKEADETEYWLLLCKHSQHLSTPTDDFLQKLKEIQLILSKIISTSKS